MEYVNMNIQNTELIKELVESKIFNSYINDNSEKNYNILNIIYAIKSKSLDNNNMSLIEYFASADRKHYIGIMDDRSMSDKTNNKKAFYLAAALDDYKKICDFLLDKYKDSVLPDQKFIDDAYKDYANKGFFNLLAKMRAKKQAYQLFIAKQKCY